MYISPSCILSLEMRLVISHDCLKNSPEKERHINQSPPSTEQVLHLDMCFTFTRNTAANQPIHTVSVVGRLASLWLMTCLVYSIKGQKNTGDQDEQSQTGESGPVCLSVCLSVWGETRSQKAVWERKPPMWETAFLSMKRAPSAPEATQLTLWISG